MPDVANHATADQPVQAEQPRWLKNDEFLRLFLREVIRSDEIGGISAVVALVRSLSKASGTPPRTIIATVQTFLLTCDHENPVLH